MNFYVETQIMDWFITFRYFNFADVHGEIFRVTWYENAVYSCFTFETLVTHVVNGKCLFKLFFLSKEERNLPYFNYTESIYQNAGVYKLILTFFCSLIGPAGAPRDHTPKRNAWGPEFHMLYVTRFATLVRLIISLRKPRGTSHFWEVFL